MKRIERYDRALRSFTKKVLHLPKSTATSFLYTKTRDGGLGLPCIFEKVMKFLRGQLRKLQTSSDLWIIALAQTQLVQKMQRRIEKFKDRNWQQEFSRTWQGHGADSFKANPVANFWLPGQTKFFKGRVYNQAVQLRTQLFPTRRTQYNTDPATNMCRHGCPSQETIQHVLQSCPFFQGARIKRHDKVVNSLAEYVQKNKFKFLKETYLTKGTQRLKPDLIIVKEEVAFVVDVTVAYDHPEVFKRAAEEKVQRKYSVLTPSDIPGLGEVKAVEVIPIVLGAGGGWRRANSKLDKVLKLPRSFAKINIIRTIKESITMLRLHSSLQRRNSRNGNTNNTQSHINSMNGMNVGPASTNAASVNSGA
ncbi:hypothetical protein QYM36_003564 [Artemia franciscana]|uniref:Reverse transcriptase n=1 Tax=Artemia franciscana TaxID=6661 RepID=A0AA88I487_ARTSF|nr:hypothetical protein QYM36_003564 [Artemia franciscana]